MHFQIYIPGQRGADPKMLEAVGLGDFVAGAEFLEVADGPCFGGSRLDDPNWINPSGRSEVPCPGVVIGWRRPGAVEIGYFPDRQTWIPAVARDGLSVGRYWVGFWNEKPTTPGDLARPYPQPGVHFEFGDGQQWLLPAAKELDATMKLNDDGTWRFEVQRRFHGFFIEYGRWLQFFGTAGPEAEFLFADGADFVLHALRINYRLVPEAAAHLGLFTKSTVLQGVLAIMGISRPPGA